jgi:signal transduction histidine kinase
VTDDAAAWSAHAIQRERTAARTALALLAFIFPLWSFLDYGLEPALAPGFCAIRFAVAASALAGWWYLGRSQTRRFDRPVVMTSVLATGISVAYFIALVERSSAYHYTIGYSLVFWGFGLLLIWPATYTVAAFAVTLSIHVALSVGIAGDTGPVFFSMLLFLITSAGISTAISIIRRRLEYQAFVAASALERKNGELATALATLEDAQARLVATEKLSALGRLIAQLSHEINNPVNVIENNIEPLVGYLTDLEQVLDIARGEATGALAQRWSELDIDFIRKDMRDALSSMAVAAERIRTIQSDLRTFLRGDATQRDETDLNAGVRSTVALLRRNLAPHTVIVERYGELPPARFHVGQINQVTMNLLQNALDVVSSGGRIEVETRTEPDAVVLSVTDSGPGVSETARRHLFEPFFTTKEVGKGTGLGLATCYQILEAHGGTIALDESWRSGARFVVRLPRTTRP